MVPQPNSNSFYTIYFVVFIFIGFYFITNLFTGVVVSTYNREKEKLGNDFLMTEKQKKWLHIKLLVIQAKPKLFLKEPQADWRKWFHAVGISKNFERFISVVIVFNTITLALTWYG